MRTLLDMSPGEIASVDHYTFEEIPFKLIEIGCLPDCEIEYIKSAPLQDPIYIRIEGNYLAIRRDIAQKIHIKNAQS